MTTARELMTRGAECVRPSDTLVTAAQRMRELDVGAMPICGDDDRLAGMITDRDIVVKCIADGVDPKSAEVGRFAEGKPVTIGARTLLGPQPTTRGAGSRRRRLRDRPHPSMTGRAHDGARSTTNAGERCAIPWGGG